MLNTDCPITENKKIKDTHILFLLPAHFSIEKIIPIMRNDLNFDLNINSNKKRFF